MHGKIAVISPESFMEAFLPEVGDMPPSTPKLALEELVVEKDMYIEFPTALNAADACPGFFFVATPHQGDKAATSLLAPDLGMYPADRRPPVREKKDNKGSTRTVADPDWSSMEIVIECKSRTSYDPFCDISQNGEPEAIRRKAHLGQLLSYAELVFKHQHRTHQFMIMFFAKYARLVRVDRSGVFATKRFGYGQDHGQAILQDFFWRYSQMSPEARGHDTTVERVLPNTKLANEVGARLQKLKESNSDSHITRFLVETMEGKPLWKIKVCDESNGGKACYFVVGEPHFTAPGVRGRGTRGYVALAVNDDETVGATGYMKDAWRVLHDGIMKEGDTLKVLNEAGVLYIPTLVCHGDVADQKTLASTKWQDLVKGRPSPLKTHQHYRMVVEEVGKPLSEFSDSGELVMALLHCLIAHEEAFKAGYIHRDISAGNILLYLNAQNIWCGMLTDWELSKNNKAELVPRQPERTGTWAFLSANILNDPGRVVVIPDELESVFHVLIYYAVRFLRHNLDKQSIGRFLHDYFYGSTPSQSGDRCGRYKLEVMRSGEISLWLYNEGCANDPLRETLRFSCPPVDKAEDLDISSPETEASDSTSSADRDGLERAPPRCPVTPPPPSPNFDHPLNALIETLLSWFRAHYAVIHNAEQLPSKLKYSGAKKKTVLDSSLESRLKAFGDALPRVSPVKKQLDEKERSRLASMITSHREMQKVFLSYLQQELPAGDKITDQKPEGSRLPRPDASEDPSVEVNSAHEGASLDQQTNHSDDEDYDSDTAAVPPPARAGSPYMSSRASAKRKLTDFVDPDTPTKRSKC